MDDAGKSMARRIAQAAKAFEHQRTGRVPRSVTVVLSEDVLVVTLRGALSEAEKNLAKNPEGAATLQEFYRQLFAGDSHSLREEIKRIIGVEAREAIAEIESSTGAVIGVFASGAIVQVYLLAEPVSSDAWSENGPPPPPRRG